MDYTTICAQRSRTIPRANANGNSRIYARYDNQLKNELERNIEKMYGNAGQCFCLANGMACLNFAIFCLKPKRILADIHIDHEAYDLLQKHYENVRFMDFRNTARLSAVADKGTMALFDVISNPLCKEYDTKNICAELHKSGTVVVADNTMLTSYYFNPFNDGADIVIESLSKYACGHGDAMGGAILFKNKEKPTNEDVGLSGYTITPDAAYMISRGMATMQLRLERIRKTTEKVQTFIVSKGIRVLGADARCGMITFTIGNSLKNNLIFVSKMKLLKNCFNFGQDNTVISDCWIYPQDEEQGTSRIRLCIGLEDADDIIQDLDSALQAIGWDAQREA